VNYDELEYLRSHPAWALLRSSHAPLVLSFLGRVFVDRNAADLSAPELIAQLDDELYALNHRLGEGKFPKPAAAYLDDWASDQHGWLRKYYPPGSDEAHYDLAPAVERALMWVGELQAREFVGTESRLNTIFELLRQMVFGADEDPEHHLVELRRRRAQLDEEIQRAETGDITILDALSQRDRYQQFARTSRELLSDFREVEENFRRLDRSLREKIAGWSGPKGTLLDDAVGSRHGITESDQGRSFQAFYDLLLSYQRQMELSSLLERLSTIEHLADQDERLAHIHFDWIDACERTQTTVRLLSDQLRRFLDDQGWAENRRVFDLLRAIEAKALKVRDLSGGSIVIEIDDTRVSLKLPTERPLYRKPTSTAIETTAMAQGDEDFDSSALLTQAFVDRDQLVHGVLHSLRRRDQVGLGEILEEQPLQQGLAELVGYISLAAPGLTVVYDEDQREHVTWETDDTYRVADVPHVTFHRDRSRQP
jgi:Protein of unknown function (DUF3375)